MRLGDILLIRYKLDPIAWLIRKITKCNYNHVAWILNKNYIIQSRRYGVQITHINEFKNGLMYELKVVRLKEIDSLQLGKAISYALSSIKKGNILQLWKTYWLILINSDKKHPRLTCSGFISKCLSKVGFYFDKRKRPENITPADIERSKRTYEINLKDY